MKKFIKKIIPKPLLNLRHLFYAWLGSVKYGHPSEEMLVIGITGTSGKSTTAYLLRQILERAGYIVGSLSTIDFYVAGEDKLNDKKMTMLGKMQIQKYLREMADKGCSVAIVETTSEGRVQHRHRFINYDMMLLTNLYPEHVESHGSYENYMQAKIDIFDYVAGSKRKVLNGETIEKIALVNRSVKGYTKFVKGNFDEVIEFSGKAKLHLDSVRTEKDGIHFRVHERDFFAPMYGEHNAMNIVSVMAVARALDISWSKIQESVSTFTNVPGRLEFIKEAEEKGFQVIVDYAFEPRALKSLFAVVNNLDTKKVICVTGNTGGGRDKPDKKVACIAEYVDTVIVTNEDPYYDDPKQIIDGMVKIFEDLGMKRDKNLFSVLDRKDGIIQALSLAKKGDVVLVTGKGSEQAMVVKDMLVPWDDRKVVRELLASTK
jgi:UDP-N-acetylmuramoyl-L-alanyl-D-glutamate--2,6-diaminopimelate ligase